MITAVILNWNTADYTIRAVRTLEGDGLPLERIVVVDNGSTDDSFERFGSEIDGAVLVRLEQNIGFARASNLGPRTLPGSSYLFVNSDAFLHRPGSIERMLRALDDRSVGIVAPKILNLDETLQPSVVPHSTPGPTLMRASGLSRFLPNWWQPSWSTHWDHSSSREIQAANGAVLLVRAETWDELGGFDEAEHMYAEDLDICWRASRLGWRTWFVHDAEFLHVGAGSTGGNHMDPARAARVGRAMTVMLGRNLSPRAARLTLAFMWSGFRARAAWYRLRHNRPAEAEMRGSLQGLAEGRKLGATLRPPRRGT